MLRMIQAITEIDRYQAIPAISYKRKQLCTTREDTAQYDRYVLHPARKLRAGGHPNFTQRQQTTWTPEPFESRLKWLRAEALAGLARTGTLS